MDSKIMKFTKGLLCALAFVPVVAFANEGGPHLDAAPDVSKDQLALQHGAKIFVNYCLNCHSASYMRYNRLKDIGLTEEQIKDNLMFASDKVGELMQVSTRRDDAKKWFGAAPPDLTVIERSRGADWLYTYLRSFYRDDTRPTGWNNVVFANVGMPHVLWQLQGENRLHVEKKGEEEHKSLVLDKPGLQKPAEYDKTVADLVGFLKFMGEPAAESRKSIGVFVLIAFAILTVLSYLLKKNYWKDIH
jgi:ubiquinol-cytochrome c reductase cytochrome c1 subunit